MQREYLIRHSKPATRRKPRPIEEMAPYQLFVRQQMQCRLVIPSNNICYRARGGRVPGPCRLRAGQKTPSWRDMAMRQRPEEILRVREIRQRREGNRNTETTPLGVPTQMSQN